MADNGQHQEVDLDRTDQLPILEGTSFADDVADDAVRLEFAPLARSVKSEFRRASGPSGSELPSLADSMRAVEERIARRAAEHEALTRSLEQARAATAVEQSLVAGLSAELAALRTELDAERARSAELAALSAQLDAERARSADVAALRTELDAERARSADVAALRTQLDAEQARSGELSKALSAREATLTQVLHSLAERDTQLHALQREHAQIVPSLEERSSAAGRLAADLQTARAGFETATAELAAARREAASLTARLERSDGELAVTRRDLGAAKAQATAHLELLRTREFRRGLADSGVSAADQESLTAERDELRRRVGGLGAQLATKEEAIARLESAAADARAARNAAEIKVQELERTCADLAGKLSAGSDDAQRRSEVLSAAEHSRADLALEVLRLQAEAQERELQMEVLLAHLQQARRSLGFGGVDAGRSTGGPGAGDPAASVPPASARTMDELMEENRSLRSALEEARGAARAAAASATPAGAPTYGTVTSGGTAAPAGTATHGGTAAPAGTATPGATAAPAATAAVRAAGAPAVEYSVDLIRIDAGHNETYPVSRRTRIGRAPGCEVLVDSSSVSRHHALLLTNLRDVIVEDLRSTNGVLVNGRKVSRQLLTDGDILTVGDVEFRLSVKPGRRETELMET
jgi:chromosome segregation ATPase